MAKPKLRARPEPKPTRRPASLPDPEKIAERWVPADSVAAKPRPGLPVFHSEAPGGIIIDLYPDAVRVLDCNGEFHTLPLDDCLLPQVDGIVDKLVPMLDPSAGATRLSIPLAKELQDDLSNVHLTDAAAELLAPLFDYHGLSDDAAVPSIAHQRAVPEANNDPFHTALLAFTRMEAALFDAAVNLCDESLAVFSDLESVAMDFAAMLGDLSGQWIEWNIGMKAAKPPAMTFAEKQASALHAMADRLERGCGAVEGADIAAAGIPKSLRHAGEKLYDLAQKTSTQTAAHVAAVVAGK